MNCKDVIENVIMILSNFDDTQIEEAYDAMYDKELFEKLRGNNELVVMAVLDKSVFKALEYIAASV